MTFDVRRFDIYRKVPKDLTQPTLTGAIVSICCCVFITLLFLSEFLAFIKPEIVSELFVDASSSSEDRIPVRLNISLPELNCDHVGLDIQDELGRHEVGFVEDTDKHILPDGGCRFEGRFYVNKVPGNFHVSTHSLASDQPDKIVMRHIIHELTFGDPIKEEWNIPGSYNTLSGKNRTTSNEMEAHEYFLKIVPSVFQLPSSSKVYSYQYTYAYKHHISFQFGGRAIPAIWFRYDLSPITVQYHVKSTPLYSFLTMLCAIVGGTFTVAGIIDSCIFSASELLRKNQLGKLS